MLEIHWMIDFYDVPGKQRQSREDIDRLLSQSKVELCAHYQLSHPEVVAALYRLLCPQDDDSDPIDKWEAGRNNGTSTVACEECTTIVEIRGVNTYMTVDSKRYLGRGETRTDPNWHAQCGAQEGASTVTEKLN